MPLAERINKRWDSLWDATTNCQRIWRLRLMDIGEGQGFGNGNGDGSDSESYSELGESALIDSFWFRAAIWIRIGNLRMHRQDRQERTGDGMVLINAVNGKSVAVERLLTNVNFPLAGQKGRTKTLRAVISRLIWSLELSNSVCSHSSCYLFCCKSDSMNFLFKLEFDLYSSYFHFHFLSRRSKIENA